MTIDEVTLDRPSLFGLQRHLVVLPVETLPIRVEFLHYDHFDHGFVVLKDAQLRLTLRRVCVLVGYIIHLIQLLNLLLSLTCWVLVLESRSAPLSWWLVCLGWTLLLFERSISITVYHRSRAGIQPILKPASSEMISDSVELSETAVCFWHIQLTATNVQLPKNTQTTRSLFRVVKIASKIWVGPSLQRWATKESG